MAESNQISAGQAQSLVVRKVGGKLKVFLGDGRPLVGVTRIEIFGNTMEQSEVILHLAGVTVRLEDG